MSDQTVELRKAAVEEIIRATWEAGYAAGKTGMEVHMHVVWDGLKPRIETTAYRPRRGWWR